MSSERQSPVGQRAQHLIAAAWRPRWMAVAVVAGVLPALSPPAAVARGRTVRLSGAACTEKRIAP